jgi:hypothetical protein
MKKTIKLLLMIFFCAAGIFLAVMAFAALLDREPMVIPGSHSWIAAIYVAGLSVCYGIAVKKLYDSWYD